VEIGRDSAHIGIMSVSTLVFLVVIFLPAIVALVAGRNFVWKFLAIFCCCAVFGVFMAYPIDLTFIILIVVPWIAAWIFAGVAVSAKRREKMFASMTER
jgi:hypothetical protein